MYLSLEAARTGELPLTDQLSLAGVLVFPEPGVVTGHLRKTGFMYFLPCVDMFLRFLETFSYENKLSLSPWLAECIPSA